MWQSSTLFYLFSFFLSLYVYNTINTKQILVFFLFVLISFFSSICNCDSMACRISKYIRRNDKRRSSGKDCDKALRDDAGTANVTVRAKQAQGDHAKRLIYRARGLLRGLWESYREEQTFFNRSARLRSVWRTAGEREIRHCTVMKKLPH